MLSSASEPPSIRIRAARVMAVAGAYWALGKLALLLAIPPGYATAIWPSAGVALAAALRWGGRVWPGVFLGSLLLNFPTSHGSGLSAAHAALLSALIGAGASLQAVLGMWLVRRFARFPNRLDEGTLVGKFLLLAGPAVCFSSAAIGVGALVVTDVLPADQAFRGALTWWAGDTVGVILVAPALLIWSQDRDRTRGMQVTLSMGALAALVTTLILLAGTAEEGRVQFEFWTTLGGAGGIAGLATAFILVLTGRPALVERIVADRTAELSKANHALAVEIKVRRRIEATLREAEQRQRTLVEFAPEAILILDFDEGRFVEVNSKAAELFWIGARQLKAMSPADLSPGTQPDGSDSRERIREILALVLEGRALSFEWTFQTPAGRTFPGEVHLVRLPQEGRRLIRVSVIDISDRKRMERMKDEFVSTVSHELRTPLTAIRGSLGLLAGGVLGVLEPRPAEMIGMATKNVERLVRLINDILDIQKIESGRMEFQRVPVDLETLVRSTAETCREYARRFDVSLEVAGSADSAVVLADPDRVTQVLTNLVSNASKFSPAGAEVRVDLERSGGRLRVEVSDRGPGIPEEFRPRLFQKFAQVDSSDNRRKGGTGLGLSICKALIERMGGSAGYRPREGGGSVFWIDLPEWLPCRREAEPAGAR